MENKATLYKQILSKLSQLHTKQKELLKKVRSSLEDKRIEKIKQDIYDRK